MGSTGLKRKEVRVGNLALGGGNAVVVQSMLSLPADDIEGNVAQALRLERAGCRMIRAAVPDSAAARLIYRLKEVLVVPVVADIHFDYRLALLALEAGADKIRINPGNIGSDDRVKAVADSCKSRGVPIRIGVNSGSLPAHILKKFGHPTPEAMCETALYHASLLEKFDFDDIVISLKSSDVVNTIASYRLMANACGYPLHLGVTEAGTERMGIIKSAVGIGSLLADGIGDTIRVSLTADSEKEVSAAYDILRAVGLHNEGVNFISCPTCGRTKVDLIALTRRAEEAFADYRGNITVAIMGCVVNGPGEAREADIGIAAGDGCGILFKKGQIVKKVEESRLIEELRQMADEF